MQEQFTDWFAYNHEANSRFIQVLTGNTIENSRIVEIFSHILNAHRIWLNRIQATGVATPAVWQVQSIAGFASINEQIFNDTKLLLQSASGLLFSQPVAYANSKGEAFTNTVQEILFHVLAHSAYHRGQVALLLRNANTEPPLSDYILYKRE